MSQKQKTSKAVWAGCVISFLAGAPFVLSGVMKILMVQPVIEGFGKYGWAQSLLIPIGILELACVVLYFIPPVSVLGAILLTGYIGGAIATDLRVGNPVYVQSVIGILVWGGLYLRDARLRELLPMVRKAS
jgi:DoxX-like family